MLRSPLNLSSKGGHVRLGIDRQSLAWRDATSRHEAIDFSNLKEIVAKASISNVLDKHIQGSTNCSELDLAVGNDLAVYWVQTPALGVASFAELKLLAQIRCADLHGGTTSDWWVSGAWHASRPFVCAGIPRASVASAEKRLTALRIQPRWHSLWGCLMQAHFAAFPPVGWCALRSPRRVVVWHCQRGDVQCIASLSTTTAGTQQMAIRQAQEWIRSEVVRGDYSGGEVIHWLDLCTSEPGSDKRQNGIQYIRRPNSVPGGQFEPQIETEAQAALFALHSTHESFK